MFLQFLRAYGVFALLNAIKFSLSICSIKLIIVLILGVSSITCDSLHFSLISQVRDFETMSGFPGLSFLGLKSKNAVVAGGLTAFVFGVYFYTMKAAGGMDKLQIERLCVSFRRKVVTIRISIFSK